MPVPPGCGRGRDSRIFGGMKPTIDGSRAPVFVIRWPVEIEPQEVRQHIDEMREIVRGQRAAFVLDLTESGVPDAKLRKLVASELQSAFAELGDQVAGVCHVVASPIIRGMMTAVYWLAPPPFETMTTSDLDAAVVWAKKRLSRA